MTTERYIRIVAGLMILLSTTLGLLHSPWWFAFTLFVGANLFQFGLTQFCPMELILKKMGVQSWKDMASKKNTETQHPT